MRETVFTAILCVLCAGPAARADSTSRQKAPLAENKSDPSPVSNATSTEIELQIERVVPITQYAGDALLAAADPRFVLVGQVSWVQQKEVLALHSQQAFAIHSPTQLGLNGWRRGDTICLLLTRTITKGRTQWRLSATKPDAGCRGGG